jgi:hypothetical protein
MSHFCTFQLSLTGYQSTDETIDHLMGWYGETMSSTASQDLKYIRGKLEGLEPRVGLSLYLPCLLRRCSPCDLPLSLSSDVRPSATYSIRANLSWKSMGWGGASVAHESSGRNGLGGGPDKGDFSYFFHGTPPKNVLSILTYGLVNLSGSCLMGKGQAWGSGVYLSPDFKTARGYGKTLFICAVDGAEKKTGEIYVAKEGKQVLVTHLIVT